VLPIFLGLGINPELTRRQTVELEQEKSASITGCRTLAESGSESKCFRASGMPSPSGLVSREGSGLVARNFLLLAGFDNMVCASLK
jgi:hypothetical protein